MFTYLTHVRRTTARYDIRPKSFIGIFQPECSPFYYTLVAQLFLQPQMVHYTELGCESFNHTNGAK